MTQDGIMELVTKLIKTYPNTYGTYSRTEIEVLVSTWSMALEDYNDDEVMRAFKGFLVSDQKGFPPAVGQIVARIPKNPYKEEKPVNDARANKVILLKSDDYFFGSIEVGDPNTGKITYIKFEGYPYGEGDKGKTEEERVDAIKRWMRNIEENEQNAWRDHGGLFGDDLTAWHQKQCGKARPRKEEPNDDIQNEDAQVCEEVTNDNQQI